MKIFVAGATGVIGRRLIPLLVDAGSDVTAVARTEEKRKQIEAHENRRLTWRHAWPVAPIVEREVSPGVRLGFEGAERARGVEACGGGADKRIRESRSRVAFWRERQSVSSNCHTSLDSISDRDGTSSEELEVARRRESRSTGESPAGECRHSSEERGAEHRAVCALGVDGDLSEYRSDRR